MVLVHFDGPEPPINGDGNGYPYNGAYNPARREGGKASISLDEKDAITGKSLQVRLTEGKLYLEFSPWNYAGKLACPNGKLVKPQGPRAFTRDYSLDPDAWQFNTYNRMRYWVRVPANGPRHSTDGKSNVEMGTYVRRVKDTDRYSDETGGGHFYHLLNLPAVGAWTQVILNMHPDHRRGNAGAVDPGLQTHPTGEPLYNYFDAMTRFYISYPYANPTKYPCTFLLDDFEVYREPHKENDAQVFSLTATYVVQTNRLIVTWNRAKRDGKVKHEVRYAFSDIHASGWEKARRAPQAIITPTGDGGYNNMIYDTTALPLGRRSIVYVAIKPQNSTRFSQIVVPLIRTNTDSNHRAGKR
jgi:hypothetical protein